MSKIFLRRHLFTYENTILDSIKAVEKVDHFLQFSNKLSLSSDLIIIYPDNGQFKIGREVVGHEQKTNLPEGIFIEDYSSEEIQTQKLKAHTAEEFDQLIQKVMDQNVYRMRFKSFSEFECDFLSTEK